MSSTHAVCDYDVNACNSKNKPRLGEKPTEATRNNINETRVCRFAFDQSNEPVDSWFLSWVKCLPWTNIAGVMANIAGVTGRSGRREKWIGRRWV